MEVKPNLDEVEEEQTGQIVSVASVARKVKPSVVGISTLLTIRDTQYWDDTQVIEGILRDGESIDFEVMLAEKPQPS